jgi:tetratricopeptide (TPR) repeat protein
VLQQLLDCQDAYNRLNFDQANTLAESAMAAAPGHPLPLVFRTGAILAKLQEELGAGAMRTETLGRFETTASLAIAAAQARLQLAPTDAHAHLYLGTAIGARGLVQLYRGNYLTAYGDGKQAEQELLEAVRLDPGLDEAYVGLGQYYYYCGRFSGLLRFVLNLKGDTRQGIAWLERCAASQTYASVSAAFSLARIYSKEEIDYSKAQRWTSALLERYPQNHALHDYALRTAKGLGLSSPLAQALLAKLSSVWDQGWRPPVYASIEDPRSLRAPLF